MKRAFTVRFSSLTFLNAMNRSPAPVRIAVWTPVRACAHVRTTTMADLFRQLQAGACIPVSARPVGRATVGATLSPIARRMSDLTLFDQLEPAEPTSSAPDSAPRRTPLEQLRATVERQAE